MLIILEGPDHSGKTTLGLELLQSLPSPRWTYHHNEPSKAKADLVRYTDDLITVASSQELRVIHDRVFHVSEQVYGRILRNNVYDRNNLLTQWDRLLNQGIILVYCSATPLIEYSAQECLARIPMHHGKLRHGYRDYMRTLEIQIPNTYSKSKFYEYNFQTMPLTQITDSICYGLD